MEYSLWFERTFDRRWWFSGHNFTFFNLSFYYFVSVFIMATVWYGRLSLDYSLVTGDLVSGAALLKTGSLFWPWSLGVGSSLDYNRKGHVVHRMSILQGSVWRSVLVWTHAPSPYRSLYIWHWKFGSTKSISNRILISLKSNFLIWLEFVMLKFMCFEAWRSI